MKKLLTVLVALFMVVSIFAAEKPFTLGPNVSYTGSVSFSLVADKDGVSFSGSLANVDASLAFGPTSDTQAGATFGFGYTPFGGVALSLKSITFSTPYFGAYYSTGKQFVNDYFTGRVYNADGSVAGWDADFGGDYADSLKVTLPAVPGLELYITDNATEITGTGYANWFSDMALAKYTLSPFTLVGGMYVQGGFYTLGLNAKGSVNLGVFAPSIDVFAGMKDVTAASPVTIYGVKVSGSLSPVTGLTLTPALKYTEKLSDLVYRSSNIKDGKYVSLGVAYTLTATPVTFTAKTTPKYDMVPATPTFTLPLNELSAKVAVAPVSFLVKTTNADLLGSNPFTLYTEAAYADSMISAKAAVKWADVTEFATYTYIQLSGSVNVLPPLTVAADYRMEPAKSGYDARLTYVMTPEVKLTGFYGTLTADGNGNYTVINTDPTWNVKLSYSASF
ncbi:MAG TPA: hypothetical protein PKW84_02920 [Fervidobacterium sp.]|mgnify:FL=1|nr:hypothetical protein [Fervidobacterium sp.]